MMEPMHRGEMPIEYFEAIEKLLYLCCCVPSISLDMSFRTTVLSMTIRERHFPRQVLARMSQATCVWKREHYDDI